MQGLDKADLAVSAALPLIHFYICVICEMSASYLRWGPQGSSSVFNTQTLNPTYYPVQPHYSKILDQTENVGFALRCLFYMLSGVARAKIW